MEWDGRRLGRRLKLRDLNTLMALAKCGSMGRAAVELSISQPAISKAIGDMERQLGVRLLDRGPQGVEPTVYGRVLLDRGRVAFDELVQAMRHIEFLADPAAGEVRIGTSVLLASGFVAAVIKKLSHRHPRMTFHISATESDAMYGTLTARRVDLLVGPIFRPINRQAYDAEVLYEEPYVVAAAASNSWTRRRSVTLAQLVDEPWALPEPDSLTWPVAAEAFRNAKVALPRAAVTASSTMARIALAAMDHCLTIVPISVLSFPMHTPALRRVRVPLNTAHRAVGIVALKGRTLTPVAQAFIRGAREAAKTRATAA